MRSRSLLTGTTIVNSRNYWLHHTNLVWQWHLFLTKQATGRLANEQQSNIKNPLGRPHIKPRTASILTTKWHAKSCLFIVTGCYYKGIHCIDLICNLFCLTLHTCYDYLSLLAVLWTCWKWTTLLVILMQIKMIKVTTTSKIPPLLSSMRGQRSQLESLSEDRLFSSTRGWIHSLKRVDSESPEGWTDSRGCLSKAIHCQGNRPSSPGFTANVAGEGFGQVSLVKSN